MRRSDLLIKAVSFIAFLAAAVYIGYYLYEARMNPLRTVLAVPVSATESVGAEGCAVREEQVLTGGGAGVYVLAADGDKLSAGGAAAVRYSSGSAVERSGRIKEAQQRLDALSALLGGKTAADVASETVMELAYAVRGGGISDISSAATKAETYILGDEVTYTAERLKSEIASLESQLDSLSAAAAGDTSLITVPEAGVFTSRCDGFESVSPAALEELTVEGYKELFKKADGVPSDAVGRLVTGLRWYFVTVLPSEQANRLNDMRTVEVRFSRTYSGSVKMRVERVGDNEGGERVVVLSSEKYMYDAASLRELYGDVIFSEASGLRAPREALHIDDEGQTYVYVRVGIQAERADVTIVSESEEYYIVTAEAGSRLVEGAEMIVSSGELYDGKVIG